MQSINNKNKLLDNTVSFLAAMMCVACILWNIEVPTRLGFALLTEQYMAFQLGLSLTIAFLLFDSRGNKKIDINIIDFIVAALGFFALMYAAVNFSTLLMNQAYHPIEIVIIGAVVVVLVMEGIRRTAGWTLFFIVATFLVYALLADKITGALEGQALSPQRLAEYVGFDPSAVFSTPLAVGSVIIILFVFFGQLLFAAGGGEFFTDLAIAATGKTRGGSAKISIVASALFGSISGSAVSNVVTTGVVTIPLMQKGGYSKTDSGAIEAIASTGGQLTPPIMGAAAFLMAEFLDISYMTVVVAAIIPAILYYLSIFIQVDLIAGRDNITTVDEDILSSKEVLKKGWHFILPFAVLLISLFYFNYDPEDSALLASIAIIFVGFIKGYRGKKLSLTKLQDVFVQTGICMVSLILIVAAAGFVIGILNITGLGFALTLMLVDSIGNNFVLILLVSALICIFLGMGMPTSGVYVLLAALVAPSLVEAGATPIAAHMFILYFGMMSMITPPVALAAFAAASITKSNPLNTGFAAMRIGWAAYVIPFIFISTPSLLMMGENSQIAEDFIKTAIGLVAVCIGIVGFLRAKINISIRSLFITLGLGCFPIGFISNSYWENINIISCLSSLVLITVLIISQRSEQKNKGLVK